MNKTWIVVTGIFLFLFVVGSPSCSRKDKDEAQVSTIDKARDRVAGLKAGENVQSVEGRWREVCENRGWRIASFRGQDNEIHVQEGAYFCVDKDRVLRWPFDDDGKIEKQQKD